MHWCLSVIDFRKPSIFYNDSMGGDNHRCLEALLKYLKDEHKVSYCRKKSLTQYVSIWKLPLQKVYLLYCTQKVTAALLCWSKKICVWVAVHARVGMLPWIKVPLLRPIPPCFFRFRSATFDCDPSYSKLHDRRLHWTRHLLARKGKENFHPRDILFAYPETCHPRGTPSGGISAVRIWT